MGYFLFIDESGQDRRESPYEVLAGMAVEDRDLWNLIKAIQEAECRNFGIRYSHGARELKGKKILKKKTFKHARMLPEFPVEERASLARQCLEHGSSAGQRQIVALAQAKCAYVADVLDICSRFRCRCFASIITDATPIGHNPAILRKDYSFLFERFYYFLEDTDPVAQGAVVFDELEKSRSHLLVGQMDSYFKKTAKGRQRSGRIIPEPFFVHSDLTTGIQLADLAAYIISWGVRVGEMTAPGRDELKEYADTLSQLRHRSIREVNGNPGFVVWSFGVIRDMRSRDEAGE